MVLKSKIKSPLKKSKRCGYRYLKGLTSDVAIEGYANTKSDLLIQSALGISSVICMIKQIKPTKKIVITVKGNNYQDLVFQVLQEVIALVDVEGIFCSKFIVLECSDKKAVIECYGEAISPEKGCTVVKAVTYHDFSVTLENGIYYARYCVDV